MLQHISKVYILHFVSILGRTLASGRVCVLVHVRDDNQFDLRRSKENGCCNSGSNASDADRDCSCFIQQVVSHERFYGLHLIVRSFFDSVVFLILKRFVLFSLLAVACGYFIIGFLYKRYVLGARGAQQIPNYLFWIRVSHAVQVMLSYSINQNS